MEPLSDIDLYHCLRDLVADLTVCMAHLATHEHDRRVTSCLCVADVAALQAALAQLRQRLVSLETQLALLGCPAD